MSIQEIEEIGRELTIRIDRVATTGLNINNKAKGLAAFDQARKKISSGATNAVQLIESELNAILKERNVVVTEEEKNFFSDNIMPLVLRLTIKLCK